MQIVYKLKEIREEKGFSQRELAKRSNVSASMISNIESQKRHPTVMSLCLLANALNVEPCDLFSYKI